MLNEKKKEANGASIIITFLMPINWNNYVAIFKAIGLIRLYNKKG
jgi:hypothetical protein